MSECSPTPYIVGQLKVKSKEPFIFWTNNADYFSIDKFSGFIIKRRELDLVSRDEFVIKVFARQSTDNAATEISTEIAIQTTSCKVKPPIMISGKEFTVSIGKFM